MTLCVFSKVRFKFQKRIRMNMNFTFFPNWYGSWGDRWRSLGNGKDTQNSQLSTATLICTFQLTCWHVQYKHQFNAFCLMLVCKKKRNYFLFVSKNLFIVLLSWWRSYYKTTFTIVWCLYWSFNPFNTCFRELGQLIWENEQSFIKCEEVATS